MRRRRRLLLAGTLVVGLALGTGLAGCASDGAGGSASDTTRSSATTVTTLAPRSDVRVVTDIEYQPALGADLYLPTSEARDTVIVWLHGGGFVAGAKDQLASLAKALAGQGYPGMAIQYRLSRSGDAWFPATTLEDPDLQAAAADAVEDAMHAVAWLRSSAAVEHGFNARRIVLAGYSAGGITAATAAAADPDAIDGAVSLAGAAIEPDQLSAASPPLLMIHGDEDDTVPVGLARATCAAAVAKGATCTLEVLPGVGHGLPFEQPGVVVNDLLTFLGRLG